MIKEFKYFLLTDYENEEEYLRNKHKEGYELVSVSLPGIYTFKKCEPKDVIYKLDFFPQKDKENYIQMFEDYGWEYLQDMNEYSYFRKEANLTNEKENDIFCDNESRLEMIQRIMKNKLLPILVIFLCCFLPNIINVMNFGFSSHPIQMFFFILTFILLGLYISIIVKVLIGYKKLSDKYKK